LTRTSKNLAAKAIVAGIAMSAVGLLAAAPALADTDDLYTYLYRADDTGFATMDPATGVVTALPETPATAEDLVGAEVFNGVGTAISAPDETDRGANFDIFTWDITTGAESAPVTLSLLPGLQLLEVSGLDTLADGTLITSIRYETTSGDPETDHSAIASVDRVTGLLTPIVDTTSLISRFDVVSLATDPVSGGTYAFLREGSGTSFFMLLNLAGGTFGTPSPFEGAGFESGVFQGADFAADGTLYFIYGNNLVERYELSTLGAPSSWSLAARTYVADAASNYPDDYPLATLALTLGSQVSPITPPAVPVLAATGADAFLTLAGGSAALLGGFAIVLVARRRRADAR